MTYNKHVLFTDDSYKIELTRQTFKPCLSFAAELDEKDHEAVINDFLSSVENLDKWPTVMACTPKMREQNCPDEWMLYSPIQDFLKRKITLYLFIRI